MATWQIVAQHPDRTWAGILSGGSADLTLRFNEVGSWSLNQPRDRCPDDWPTAGARVVFMRSGVVIASGTLDEDTFAWSADPTADDGGAGQYTLTGDTDLGYLGYRIVFPTPDVGWSRQGAYYVHGPARPMEALRFLVSRQAGPSAHPARVVDRLTIGDDDWQGTPTFTVRERFTPLLDACRKIAAADNLAFDVIDQLNGNVRLIIWRVRDLSRDIRFGVELGNVVALNVQRKAPTGNRVLLAGGGELDSRALFGYGDGDAVYGRREVFIDQRQVGEGEDNGAPTAEQRAEYDKAGQEAVDENRSQTAVNATIRDTETTQWGRDYGLGDKVAVLTPWGPVTDIVREVRITVDAAGVEDISSVIGTVDLTADDPLIGTVNDLTKRISQLERSH